jgi:predicted TIM-barrel fold metal-dependent hydrolase
MGGTDHPEKTRIDFHLHLAGDGSSGSGCLMSRRLRRRPVTWYLCHSVGLPRARLGAGGDRVFLQALLGHINGAREIDYGLLMAYDRVRRDDGAVDDGRLELYVPNDYVLGIAAREPKALAGVSIHPYRPDALDELDRCAELGAAAVKWLPTCQNIDPADPRCRPFFRRMAQHGIPLISHTGPENALTVLRPDLQDPRILKPALECGVNVVAAHCGLSVLPWQPHCLEGFLEILGDFPNAWGDVSAFSLPRSPGLVRRVVRDGAVVTRLIHGSDWPLPIHARWLTGLVPWSAARDIDRDPNPLDRAVRIMRAFGLPESLFGRAASIIPPRLLGRLPPKNPSG